jgi:hypothetical protein
MMTEIKAVGDELDELKKSAPGMGTTINGRGGQVRLLR